nr:hypothetical protein [uncultured Methanoregula sp.]
MTSPNISFLKSLPDEEKARLFDEMVTRLETQNKSCGVIFGSIQLIEIMEDDAVKLGFKKCPCCGRGGRS